MPQDPKAKPTKDPIEKVIVDWLKRHQGRARRGQQTLPPGAAGPGTTGAVADPQLGGVPYTFQPDPEGVLARTAIANLMGDEPPPMQQRADAYRELESPLGTATRLTSHSAATMASTVTPWLGSKEEQLRWLYERMGYSKDKARDLAYSTPSTDENVATGFGAGAGLGAMAQGWALQMPKYLRVAMAVASPGTVAAGLARKMGMIHHALALPSWAAAMAIIHPVTEEMTGREKRTLRTRLDEMGVADHYEQFASDMSGDAESLYDHPEAFFGALDQWNDEVLGSPDMTPADAENRLKELWKEHHDTSLWTKAKRGGKEVLVAGAASLLGAPFATAGKGLLAGFRRQASHFFTGTAMLGGNEVAKRLEAGESVWDSVSALWRPENLQEMMGFMAASWLPGGKALGEDLYRADVQARNLRGHVRGQRRFWDAGFKVLDGEIAKSADGPKKAQRTADAERIKRDGEKAAAEVERLVGDTAALVKKVKQARAAGNERKALALEGKIRELGNQVTEAKRKGARAARDVQEIARQLEAEKKAETKEAEYEVKDPLEAKVPAPTPAPAPKPKPKPAEPTPRSESAGQSPATETKDVGGKEVVVTKASKADAVSTPDWMLRQKADGRKGRFPVMKVDDPDGERNWEVRDLTDPEKRVAIYRTKTEADAHARWLRSQVKEGVGVTVEDLPPATATEPEAAEAVAVTEPAEKAPAAETEAVTDIAQEDLQEYQQLLMDLVNSSVGAEAGAAEAVLAGQVTKADPVENKGLMERLRAWRDKTEVSDPLREFAASRESDPNAPFPERGALAAPVKAPEAEAVEPAAETVESLTEARDAAVEKHGADSKQGKAAEKALKKAYADAELKGKEAAEALAVEKAVEAEGAVVDVGEAEATAEPAVTPAPRPSAAVPVSTGGTLASELRQSRRVLDHSEWDHAAMMASQEAARAKDKSLSKEERDEAKAEHRRWTTHAMEGAPRPLKGDQQAFLRRRDEHTSGEVTPIEDFWAAEVKPLFDAGKDVTPIPSDSEVGHHEMQAALDLQAASNADTDALGLLDLAQRGNSASVVASQTLGILLSEENQGRLADFSEHQLATAMRNHLEVLADNESLKDRVLARRMGSLYSDDGGPKQHFYDLKQIAELEADSWPIKLLEDGTITLPVAAILSRNLSDPWWSGSDDRMGAMREMFDMLPEPDASIVGHAVEYYRRGNDGSTELVPGTPAFAEKVSELAQLARIADQTYNAAEALARKYPTADTPGLRLRTVMFPEHQKTFAKYLDGVREMHGAEAADKIRLATEGATLAANERMQADYDSGFHEAGTMLNSAFLPGLGALASSGPAGFLTMALGATLLGKHKASASWRAVDDVLLAFSDGLRDAARGPHMWFRSLLDKRAGKGKAGKGPGAKIRSKIVGADKAFAEATASAIEGYVRRFGRTLLPTEQERGLNESQAYARSMVPVLQEAAAKLGLDAREKLDEKGELRLTAAVAAMTCTTSTQIQQLVEFYAPLGLDPERLALAMPTAPGQKAGNVLAALEEGSPEYEVLAPFLEWSRRAAVRLVEAGLMSQETAEQSLLGHVSQVYGGMIGQLGRELKDNGVPTTIADLAMRVADHANAYEQAEAKSKDGTEAERLASEQMERIKQAAGVSPEVSPSTYFQKSIGKRRVLSSVEAVKSEKGLMLMSERMAYQHFVTEYALVESQVVQEIYDRRNWNDTEDYEGGQNEWESKGKVQLTAPDIALLGNEGRSPYGPLEGKVVDVEVARSLEGRMRDRMGSTGKHSLGRGAAELFGNAILDAIRITNAQNVTGNPVSHMNQGVSNMIHLVGVQVPIQKIPELRISGDRDRLALLSGRQTSDWVQLMADNGLGDLADKERAWYMGEMGMSAGEVQDLFRRMDGAGWRWDPRPVKSAWRAAKEGRAASALYHLMMSPQFVTADPTGKGGAPRLRTRNLSPVAWMNKAWTMGPQGDWVAQRMLFESLVRFGGMSPADAAKKVKRTFDYSQVPRMFSNKVVGANFPYIPWNWLSLRAAGDVMKEDPARGVGVLMMTFGQTMLGRAILRGMMLNGGVIGADDDEEFYRLEALYKRWATRGTPDRTSVYDWFTRLFLFPVGSGYDQHGNWEPRFINMNTFNSILGGFEFTARHLEELDANPGSRSHLERIGPGVAALGAAFRGHSPDWGEIKGVGGGLAFLGSRMIPKPLRNFGAYAAHKLATPDVREMLGLRGGRFGRHQRGELDMPIEHEILRNTIGVSILAPSTGFRMNERENWGRDADAHFDSYRKQIIDRAIERQIEEGLSWEEATTGPEFEALVKRAAEDLKDWNADWFAAEGFEYTILDALPEESMKREFQRRMAEKILPGATRLKNASREEQRRVLRTTTNAVQ